ncbi:hypothetical protein, partial [Cellvibrio sp. NN19]|uniref:hypothetical protein n=1 Tax=Cellvibrio chitinivorans TaxID=3102792 RepID=UPI002B411417
KYFGCSENNDIARLRAMLNQKCVPSKSKKCPEVIGAFYRPTMAVGFDTASTSRVFNCAKNSALLQVWTLLRI